MAVAEAPHSAEVTNLVYENGPKRACDMLARTFAEYTLRDRGEIEDPEGAAQMFLTTLQGDLFFRVMLTAYRPTPVSYRPELYVIGRLSRKRPHFLTRGLCRIYRWI